VFFNSLVEVSAREPHMTCLAQVTLVRITTKAFENDWFNKTHNLSLPRAGLKQLLEIAAKNQLFQFNGHLYEQKDGVAMGSPLGPLMANSRAMLSFTLTTVS